MGRATLAGLPGAELPVQVVARQTQQPRHGGLNARECRTVTAAAGSDAVGRVAQADQRFAPLQQRRTCPGDLRRGIGRFQPGKVAGNFAQIAVAQVLQQTRHQRVMTAPFAKADQLVVQIAGRLAGDAGQIALIAGSAFIAVASGAGPHAFGQRVGHRPGRRLRGRRAGQAGYEQQDGTEQPKPCAQGAERAASQRLPHSGMLTGSCKKGRKGLHHCRQPILRSARSWTTQTCSL